MLLYAQRGIDRLEAYRRLGLMHRAHGGHAVLVCVIIREETCIRDYKSRESGKLEEERPK